MREGEQRLANARRLVLTVNQLLDALESGRDTSLDLQSQISQHLNAMSREMQVLETLVPNVPAAQRSIWRRRVTQLQDEMVSQRNALGKFTGRVMAKQRVEEDRQELLHRRTNGADCAINIDAIAKEGKALNESESAVDELLGFAGAMRSELGIQGEGIKNIQRKVLSIGATLGLSNNTLKMIERRLFGDKLILYGGMLLTLGLLWYVFVYLRREVPVSSE